MSKPKITRCALCAHFKKAQQGMMCTLHNHVATAHSGCTWGADVKDEEQDNIAR